MSSTEGINPSFSHGSSSVVTDIYSFSSCIVSSSSATTGVAQSVLSTTNETLTMEREIQLATKKMEELTIEERGLETFPKELLQIIVSYISDDNAGEISDSGERLFGAVTKVIELTTTSADRNTIFPEPLRAQYDAGYRNYLVMKIYQNTNTLTQLQLTRLRHAKKDVNTLDLSIAKEAAIIANCRLEQFFRNFSNIVFINFSWCKNLSTFNCEVLPSTLKEIDFHACPNLVSIGKSALSNCKKLEIINLGNCEKLTKLDCQFPQTLKKINLVGCKKLSSIRDDAFSECDQLEILDLSFNECITKFSCILPRFLKQIKLVECRCLHTVKSDICSKSAQLELFDLSRCPELIGFSCELPVTTKELNLSNCTNISYIAFGVFSQGLNTIQFNISGCRFLSSSQTKAIRKLHSQVVINE